MTQLIILIIFFAISDFALCDLCVQFQDIKDQWCHICTKSEISAYFCIHPFFITAYPYQGC